MKISIWRRKRFVFSEGGIWDRGGDSHPCCQCQPGAGAWVIFFLLPNMRWDWKRCMQVLDLLYSNMRLVPFPLKQVPRYSDHLYVFLEHRKSHTCYFIFSSDMKIWRRHCRTGAPRWEQCTLLDLTGRLDLPTTSSSSRFSSRPSHNWLSWNAGNWHFHIQHDPLPGSGKHSNGFRFAWHHCQVIFSCGFPILVTSQHLLRGISIQYLWNLKTIL